MLGGVYKFVLAKPAKAEPKPKVHGSVYMLEKEFLVNLHDGRFAKLQVGLVLAHDDTSTVAAGGHGAAPRRPRATARWPRRASCATSSPTSSPTRRTRSSSRREGRQQLKEEILKDLKKHTDVKVEHVLFSDVTVQ